MKVTEEMKKDLVKLIVENFKKEFFTVHFTGNLMDTIEIHQTEDGIAVEIPAMRYSFEKWEKEGVIVPYEKGGSYASQVDKTGGFSGKHKGYVDKCIDLAISQWLTKYHINGRIR